MEARQRSPLCHPPIRMVRDMYQSSISYIYGGTMEPEAITDANKSLVSSFTPKLLSLLKSIRCKTTGPGWVSLLLLVHLFFRI